MSAPLVPRDAADVRRELLAVATRNRLPVGSGTAPTWASLLFTDGEWSDPGEPSRALLEAVAELHAGLWRHLATVPAHLQAAWLRDRLGIAPLAGVPDDVVVAATADPARTPVVIVAGTAVRAKDSAKRERRYLTTETLTVHGTELVDVLAHGAEVVAGGAVRDTAARWTDRAEPFEPFAASVAGAPAAHRFFVLSDLLEFAGGTMDVRLTFAGPVDARGLTGVEWNYPKPGGVGRAVLLAATASTIDLQLTGGCTPADVLGTTSPYLCASLPEDERTPEALGFAPLGITVRVGRRDVRPQAAFANEGRLDPTKELRAFGDAPQRGDAFYIRSDEAFGKPLDALKVVLSLLDSSSGGVTGVPWSTSPGGAASSVLHRFEELRDELSAQANTFIEEVVTSFSPDARPRIEWQRFDGSGWSTLASTGAELKTFSWTGAAAANAPLSLPIELGGRGHFVRAFLAEGDFGWKAYQTAIAQLAADAAQPGAHPDASKLVPPDPPILSSIGIQYTTREVAPTAVASIDGWTTRHPPASGPHQLFSVPFELGDGHAGMIALCFRLGERALGTSVSLYFDVESAPACGSGSDSPLHWEYWTAGGTWRRLDVADGTLGLRQPGLLRFVAPLDWPEGSEAASAGEGRWIRAVTPDTSTVGAILAIVPDAVQALHETGPDAPDGDYDALEPGQVKGLLASAPGVKKLSNPIAGRAGRPPEAREGAGYLTRASSRVRHRDRAATAWDCEELIREGTPEVAAVRCLPHTGPDGEIAPGWIGAVVVPRSLDRMPLPSVSLAARIRARLAPALPINARLAVLCPLYVAVTVQAELVLMPGEAAVDARTRIVSDLERLLHPTATDPVRFGRELFASSIAAWLETRPEVDYVATFALLHAGTELERVTVDPCRGIIASAGDHALILREQL